MKVKFLQLSAVSLFVLMLVISTATPVLAQEG